MSEIIDHLAYLAAMPAPDDIVVQSEQRARWTWATVTQESPLRVRLDGQSQSLDMTPDSLVGGLRVNDRVKAVLIEKGLLVVGVATSGQWANITIHSPFAAQGASNVPQVRLRNGTVESRWGFSATGTSANGTFLVGQLPTGTYPARTEYRPAVSSSANATADWIIETNGTVTLRIGSTVGGYYMLGPTWPIS